MMLSGFIMVMLAVISYFFFSRSPGREAVQSQLFAMVDLVLAQESLEADLVKLHFKTDGVFNSAFGFLSKCHPGSVNRNMLELPETPKIAWNLSLRFNKGKIRNFFAETPCLNPNEVRIYAVHIRNGQVVGWSTNLEKQMKELKY